MERLVISYAIFTVGLVIICLGMNVNGGASPHNPAWVGISYFRNICLLSWLIPAAIWAFTHGEKLRKDFQNLPPLPFRPKETEAEVAAREERFRKHLEEKERAWAAVCQQRAEKEERERLRVVEEERIAEEKRVTRTAEQAATAALDDFL